MANDLIHVFPDADAVAKEVADRFLAFTQDCVDRTGSCIVALSGGTTPNALFSLLNTEPYLHSINWEEIFFLWVDERFVPQSDPDNNFFRARERLFGTIGSPCHYYPVPTNSGTVEEAADAYEKEVKTVLKASGKDRLDLVLLGLGDDGHTASLFPRSRALTEDKRSIVAVKDGKVWERVTMTFPLLAEAEHVWYTVVGDSKRAALSRVFKQRLEYEDEGWAERIGKVLPGAVLTQDGIEWFVDQEAKGKV